jgi:hypothetical protein
MAMQFNAKTYLGLSFSESSEMFWPEFLYWHKLKKVADENKGGDH